MEQTKTIKSRVQFKTDLFKNWTDFTPEQGELCICSDFSDTGLLNQKGNKIYKPALKVGIGNTPFQDLVFLLPEDYISEENILSLFTKYS